MNIIQMKKNKNKTKFFFTTSQKNVTITNKVKKVNVVPDYGGTTFTSYETDYSKYF